MYMDKILTLEHLKLGFEVESGYMEVVRGVDLTVGDGEIIGVLGESGSGKSVTVKSIFGIVEEDIIIKDGSITFNGLRLDEMTDARLTDFRFKEIAYIPQNPSDALNPYQTIKKQFLQLGRIHHVIIDEKMIIQSLNEVGIDNATTIMKMYVHQLSGGLAQRVVFAMSIILDPPLIIADEPTSAIDASLKHMVLDLIKKINREKGISFIVITHDFEVVKYIAQRVYVMYAGLVLESGKLSEVISRPYHPYTEELIRCVHSIEDEKRRFYSMVGAPESPLNYKESCPLLERCRYRMERCKLRIPDLIEVDGRQVRCVKYSNGGEPDGTNHENQ